jgi:serine/threonine-protein kinase
VIGEVLEKYEILEKIGEGGMAVVYLGRHMTLGRKVAIKVLHPHLASSDKNRIRFAREAKAIESLRHPNILRIFDYSGAESERCFIVTEFIDGPTLRGVLDEVGVMMAEPAALIARELCDAMQTAHNQGIVHRDLKPENVMIDRSGAIKLMDFGIARIVDDSHVTMTGALVGSPAFMSPEQATDSEVDHRSDLFALGIVLYRMVTGSLPFRGGNPSIVLKAIIDGNFDDPGERVPSLSPALAVIIRRCLCTDREDRYSSASEVRDALDAFLRSVGIDPDAPGQWQVLSYLTNSEGYEDELMQHLMGFLVERGRGEIERKDTAAALRTFNRVLALDGDNREVIDIIAGIRPPTRSPPMSRGSRLIWGSVAAVLVVTFAMLGVSSDGFRQWDQAREPLARLAPVPMLAIPIAERAPAPEIEPDPEPTASEASAAQDEQQAPIRQKTERVRPVAAMRVTRPTSPGPTTETKVPPATNEPSAEQIAEDARVAAIPEGIGRLRVITLNGDGQVFIDDDYIGWTPMKLISLSSGRHKVYLEETDYHFSETKQVVVLPDEDNEVMITRRYKPARVRFVGFPDDAEVELNGQMMGRISEVSSLTLDEMGDYQLAVRQGRKVLKRIKLTCGVQSKDLKPGDVQILQADR